MRGAAGRRCQVIVSRAGRTPVTEWYRASSAVDARSVGVGGEEARARGLSGIVDRVVVESFEAFGERAFVSRQGR